MKKFKKLIGWSLSFINWILPNPPKLDVKLEFSEIQATPVTKEDKYKLLKKVIFRIGDRIFTVPKGFIWDGASIPSWAWQVVGTPFFPDFMAASCLHDYMYFNVLGRKDADLYFYWILIESGVPHKTAEKMYYAVRIGGKKPYAKYKKQNEQK